ncbi:hypothetical protein TNCV_1073551 [Trichonephila clavipes]|uniref:Uncharacterized protein n=1 Tax=Trichonephila clavipes TaxID=2585209 RepID=A0A8X6STT7_TRICX|nr:hypothetical protein TNCV_1073551 [Trichonephila clavipes]
MPTVSDTIGDVDACGFLTRVNEAMDTLRTFNSDAKGVECQGQWCNEMGAIDTVDTSFPPASNDYRFASQLLGVV